MGETVPLLKPTFNRSVEIESRPDHLTADAGALIQREIMERSGIMDWLVERLHDPRNQDLITYPLADLLRTHLLLLGQGWRDQDDAGRLRQDPALRVSNSSQRGITPLNEENV
ncbi:MAG: IS1380 family transposase, partial [Gammaproteobacteria bacterium]|nr:IS1380 family transposase [Gammaproteobacteria bacterium]